MKLRAEEQFHKSRRKNDPVPALAGFQRRHAGAAVPGVRDHRMDRQNHRACRQRFAWNRRPAGRQSDRWCDAGLQARQSLTDLNQAELLDQAEDKIKPFRNDITPYSVGVLADVRSGGLKQVLSSMFEMGGTTANTQPREFSNRRLSSSMQRLVPNSLP